MLLLGNYPAQGGGTRHVSMFLKVPMRPSSLFSKTVLLTNYPV